MGNAANVEVLGHYSWVYWCGTQPVSCTEDGARNASLGFWQRIAVARGRRYRRGESDGGDVAAVEVGGVRM